MNLHWRHRKWNEVQESLQAIILAILEDSLNIAAVKRHMFPSTNNASDQWPVFLLSNRQSPEGCFR
jgi:hypothetical protein